MVQVAQKPKKVGTQIRKRTSFWRWQRFLEFLDTQPTVEEIARRVHAELDGMSAYGSWTHSQYSEESLNLALADRENGGHARAMAAEFVLGGLDDPTWGTLHLCDDVEEFCHERWFEGVEDPPEPAAEGLDCGPVYAEVCKIMARLKKEARMEILDD